MSIDFQSLTFIFLMFSYQWSTFFSIKQQSQFSIVFQSSNNQLSIDFQSSKQKINDRILLKNNERLSGGRLENNGPVIHHA